MKRLILLVFVMVLRINAADLPFHRGVNLTSWFQESESRQIKFTNFTKQDFLNIKSLGCDVIRLPINLHAMTNSEPDYTIDPLFYFFLDQAVDWTEELEMHLIFDNHSLNAPFDKPDELENMLILVWKQMAAHYRERSSYIYYEILNEPHDISDANWNNIQQNVITAIREVDQKHTLIVGPAGWNSYNNLQNMPEYTDENLIYTHHFYDPFVFTHQGASWTSPSMESLSGVPFPYEASQIPECPQDLKGTWVENNLNGYQNDGTVARVQQWLDIAIKFKNERNIPLFCGEFGVYKPNSDAGDRAFWYSEVRKYLEENGIAWTIWDYTGGFGLFESGTDEMFEYDLNISLVEALGLNPPEQKEFIIKPDTCGFTVYQDFMGALITDASSAGDNGIIDLYSEISPLAGQFCIYWTEASQYTQIGFNFKPDKDLSVLVENGYAIDFWVRGDSPGASFDIRFVDTKTEDPEDHPWRMRTQIDESKAMWDEQWHHLQIPLDNFIEHGSWDGEWFNPEGKFDWTAVDRLEIVAEHHNLAGIQFWLDAIRIVDPAVVDVAPQYSIQLPEFNLNSNFPNPFNPVTSFQYGIIRETHVEIAVYNLAGQKVKTLFEGDRTPGIYSVSWDSRNQQGQAVASGVYLCKMKSPSHVETQKMLLLR